jgi:L-asparaginase
MSDRKVLIVHTGGTLGMIGTPLEPGTYAQALTSQVPELSRIARLETEIVCNLDSSDVGPEQWAAIATTVARRREEFHGFVIVHGTDTMAFTAAALAFALRGLDRPVVLTGAQRPLAALRTDARRNLQDSVEVATIDVPEVGICFDGLLLRGCRAVKADARHYRAFDTPGLEPLARFGFDIEVGRHVRRPTEAFACDPRFDARVAVFPVTPGLDPRILDHLVDGGELRGLVLAAYGVGTVPTRERAIAPVIRRAVDAGIDVVVVTQHGGIVDLGMYRNSKALADAGAIAGGKMRIEAAVPKLMHALARFPDRAARRTWLEGDAAGEAD